MLVGGGDRRFDKEMAKERILYTFWFLLHRNGILNATDAEDETGPVHPQKMEERCVDNRATRCVTDHSRDPSMSPWEFRLFAGFYVSYLTLLRLYLDNPLPKVYPKHSNPEIVIL